MGNNYSKSSEVAGVSHDPLVRSISYTNLGQTALPTQTRNRVVPRRPALSVGSSSRLSNADDISTEANSYENDQNVTNNTDNISESVSNYRPPIPLPPRSIVTSGHLRNPRGRDERNAATLYHEEVAGVSHDLLVRSISYTNLGQTALPTQTRNRVVPRRPALSVGSSSRLSNADDISTEVNSYENDQNVTNNTDNISESVSNYRPPIPLPPRSIVTSGHLRNPRGRDERNAATLYHEEVAGVSHDLLVRSISYTNLGQTALPRVVPRRPALSVGSSSRLSNADDISTEANSYENDQNVTNNTDNISESVSNYRPPIPLPPRSIVTSGHLRNPRGRDERNAATLYHEEVDTNSVTYEILPEKHEVFILGPHKMVVLSPDSEIDPYEILPEEDEGFQFGAQTTDNQDPEADSYDLYSEPDVHSIIPSEDYGFFGVRKEDNQDPEADSYDLYSEPDVHSIIPSEDYGSFGMRKEDNQDPEADSYDLYSEPDVHSIIPSEDYGSFGERKEDDDNWTQPASDDGESIEELSQLSTDGDDSSNDVEFMEEPYVKKNSAPSIDSAFSDKSTASVCSIECMVEVHEKRIVESVYAEELLPYLSCLDEDTTYKIDNIQQNNPLKAMRILLQCLKRSQILGKWQNFVDALNHSEYTYFAKLLTNECELNYEEQIGIIRIFKPKLIDRIYFNELIDKLYARGVISEYDKDQIYCEEKNKGSKRAASLVLKRIQTRLPNWFDEFMQACSECQLEDVIDMFYSSGQKTPSLQDQGNENTKQSQKQRYPHVIFTQNVTKHQTTFTPEPSPPLPLCHPLQETTQPEDKGKEEDKTTVPKILPPPLSSVPSQPCPVKHPLQYTIQLKDEGREDKTAAPIKPPPLLSPEPSPVLLVRHPILDTNQLEDKEEEKPSSVPDKPTLPLSSEPSPALPARHPLQDTNQLKYERREDKPAVPDKPPPALSSEPSPALPARHPLKVTNQLKDEGREDKPAVPDIPPPPLSSEPSPALPARHPLQDTTQQRNDEEEKPPLPNTLPPNRKPAHYQSSPCLSSHYNEKYWDRQSAPNRQEGEIYASECNLEGRGEDKLALLVENTILQAKLEEEKRKNTIRRANDNLKKKIREISEANENETSDEYDSVDDVNYLVTQGGAGQVSPDTTTDPDSGYDRPVEDVAKTSHKTYPVSPAILQEITIKVAEVVKEELSHFSEEIKRRLHSDELSSDESTTPYKPVVMGIVSVDGYENENQNKDTS